MNHNSMGIMTTHLACVIKQMNVFVLACACLVSTPAVLAQNVAGVVKKSEGNVSIQRGGKNMAAPVGTQVMAGDVLRTADGSSTGVMMKDETRLSLGPNSQLVVDKFGFNVDSHAGGMFISVVKGTLMMITGLLVKNPGAVTVKTPTTTAGVRGTQFIVDVP